MYDWLTYSFQSQRPPTFLWGPENSSVPEWKKIRCRTVKLITRWPVCDELLSEVKFKKGPPQTLILPLWLGEESITNQTKPSSAGLSPESTNEFQNVSTFSDIQQTKSTTTKKNCSAGYKNFGLIK